MATCGCLDRCQLDVRQIRITSPAAFSRPPALNPAPAALLPP
ncbi:MAG: hypothetical protein ACK5CQ_08110 [Cyanobacteriota bacterium]